MTCPSCSQALNDATHSQMVGRGALCLCKKFSGPKLGLASKCGAPVSTPLHVGDANGPKAPVIAPTELPQIGTRSRGALRTAAPGIFRHPHHDASMQTVGGFFGELFANRVGRPMQPGMNRLFTRDAATAEIIHPQLTEVEASNSNNRSGPHGKRTHQRAIRRKSSSSGSSISKVKFSSYPTIVSRQNLRPTTTSA